MAADSSGPRLHPRLVREFPPDLTVCVLVTVLTVLAATVPIVRETPLRVVLGLPFVLFVPGYVFVAALFPEAGAGPGGDDDGADGEDTTETEDDGENEGDDSGMIDRDGGIDGIERVALSVGLSIAVVPLLGLGLNFTPWGIRLLPILVAVGGFVLLASVVAAYRRLALPPAERFRVPYRQWYESGRAELLEPDSRLDLALNVLLALSVVLAASSVVYAVAVPKPGESFTEYYVLTENETGDLVADDYPTEFVEGEAKSLVMGIENNEHQRVNYSVVVAIQNVTFEGGSGPANATANATVAEVVDQSTLDRFGVALGHNETWLESYSVRPTMAGEDLRLAFLLYRDGVPATPSVENAYRELHLWVNVTR